MMQNMQKINNMAKERIKTDLFIKKPLPFEFFNYCFVNSIPENVKKKNAIRKNIDIIGEISIINSKANLSKGRDAKLWV